MAAHNWRPRNVGGKARQHGSDALIGYFEAPPMRKFDEVPTSSPDQKRELAFRQNGRDMVSAEVEQMLRRRGSDGLPDEMPKTIAACTAFILDVLIDPPADDETIRRVPAFAGFSWETPYRDRVVYLARRFLALPVPTQRQIISYAKSGLKWRGDDPEFLALVAAAKLTGKQTDNFSIKRMEIK